MITATTIIWCVSAAVTLKSLKVWLFSRLVNKPLASTVSGCWNACSM